MSYFYYISIAGQRITPLLHGFSSWLSRPTALCFRDGPDGVTGPFGKNPKKWLAAPRSSGRPLKGCMPLEASQLELDARARRRRSRGRTYHRSCGGRVVLLLFARPM